MRTRKWLIILLLLLLLILLFLNFFRGCEKTVENKPFEKKTGPLLVSIIVTPVDLTVLIDKEEQFTATGIYADESRLDISSLVFWSTYPTSVATINNNGLANAVGQGTAVIMAVWGDFHGKTHLKVISKAVKSVPPPPPKEEIPMAIPKSETRFVVGNGIEGDCVLDTLSGLIWVRFPELNQRNWKQAYDYAENLSLCGYTDWRLPSRKELRGLINFNKPELAAWLNLQGFINIQPAPYWSSTIAALNSNEAWAIFIGPVYKDNSILRTVTVYTWATRYGPMFKVQ